MSIDNIFEEDLFIGISEGIVYFIEHLAETAGNQETGGILGGVGKIEKRNVVITDASGPGPAAIQESSFFSRDTEYCQSVVDDWAKKSLGAIDYIGEWHKHLEANPRPSKRDIETLKSIAGSANYHVRYPILIIIGKSNLRCSLRVFVIDDEGNSVETSWQIE